MPDLILKISKRGEFGHDRYLWLCLAMQFYEKGTIGRKNIAESSGHPISGEGCSCHSVYSRFGFGRVSKDFGYFSFNDRDSKRRSLKICLSACIGLENCLALKIILPRLFCDICP